MSENPETKETKPSGKNATDAFIGFIFITGVLLGLLYLTGWSILWGGNLWPKTDAVLFMDNGLAFRFNALYYGVNFYNRFFDSPAISWGCMVVFFVILFGGFSTIGKSHGKSTNEST